MKSTVRSLVSVSLSWFMLPVLAEAPALIVVQDVGGVSALPYYRVLKLQGGGSDQTSVNPSLHTPAAPNIRYSEADMLPVHSTRLSPGDVTHREIHAPGLTPIFLIGDDTRSRTWLREHVESLRALHAVGFVVHVDSREALDSLRRLAPGLTLAPVSGDDLAQRLNLQHYPVLIRATRIEQ